MTHGDEVKTQTDPKSVHEKRPSTLDTLDRKCARETREESTNVARRRNRVREPHVAPATDKGVGKQRDHWRNFSAKVARGVSCSSPIDGAGAAVSARTPNSRSKNFGEELCPPEVEECAGLVR